MPTSEIVLVREETLPSFPPQRKQRRRAFLWGATSVIAVGTVLSQQHMDADISAGIVIAAPRTETPKPSASQDTSADGEKTASALAKAEIPANYITLYASTAKAYTPSIPWQVYAGIGKIESDHGKSDAPGVKSGFNYPLHGCCAGPMQFYANKAMVKPGEKTTWELFGGDYNGDGKVNVYDPADAIPAAGKYLATLLKSSKGEQKCAGRKLLGSQEEVNVLWYYNNACSYGDEVLTKAALYTK